MTLTELIDAVYITTSRPDLQSESTQAVKAATLKLHGLDYFFKDLVDSNIVFPTAKTQQAFDYKVTFPRWKNIKYLRKFDSITNQGTDFITIIPPALVVDSYSVNRENVAYMAGSILNIRSSTEEISYLIGFYQHPDITTEGYSSWIAQEVPFAIVYEATMQIFKTIGKDEEEQRMRILLQGTPQHPEEGLYHQIKQIGLADMGGY